MVNPARVLNFLDVAGHWDPTLLFVMASAVPLTAFGYRFALARETSLIGEKFDLPNVKQIDFALVGGSALFGIGWGLAGICPGPAFADLATFRPEVLLFVGALLGGMLTAKCWRALIAVITPAMQRFAGKTALRESN
jgi:uncharacterized membrane protein YedE/YeeE